LVAAVDRVSTYIRCLARRLSAQAGFALVLSIGSLSILTIGGMSVVVYSTSNASTASPSTDNEFAFSLSEAGLNNAIAVLANPANNALDADTLPSSEATAASAHYEGGTAKWWGELDAAAAVWTISALGLYDNPTGYGAAQIRRKLTAKVPVIPVAPQELQPNDEAWQYMFATRTGNDCDMTLNNHVFGSSRPYSNGNLCINNNADFLGEALIVKAICSSATAPMSARRRAWRRASRRTWAGPPAAATTTRPGTTRVPTPTTSTARRIRPTGWQG